MKYLIDLGTNDGELLEKMIKNYYKDFDKYIGFEPVPRFISKATKRFADNPKVEIRTEAVSTSNQDDVKLYLNIYRKNGGPKKIGTGSTLIASKKTGNINVKKFIEIKTIDFSQYLFNHFKKDDFIVVKMDIEGEEYDLLDYLINTGAISYIDKLIIEWHHHKLKNFTEKDHYKIVKRLQDIGFDLTGDNHDDDLSMRMIKDKKIKERKERKKLNKKNKKNEN